ncbi:MAG: hypothetical protein MZU91_14800 [Desulfosudis oleivorans]|nr:hypothetical protein [Desulfosudis oleivorans]
MPLAERVGLSLRQALLRALQVSKHKHDYRKVVLADEDVVNPARPALHLRATHGVAPRRSWTCGGGAADLWRSTIELPQT